jgi:rRNA small subunit pseudouridine methyltransferase Nep1
MDDKGPKKTKEYKFKKSEEANSKKRVIVVLEHACLETIKTKKGNYELLNCDDHMTLLKKMNRDWTEVRPDITHQVRTMEGQNATRMCCLEFRSDLRVPSASDSSQTILT